MNATDMCKLTEQANQQRALKRKEEAAAAKAERLRAEASTKKWWLTQGLGQLFDRVHQAAGEGQNFYEEGMDDYPDYVVDSIRSKGFEVRRIIGRRGCGHVLLIRW